MKIGVITPWWCHENYGQLIQCWALQQYLMQQGHQPFLICYKRNRTALNRLYALFISPRLMVNYIQSHLSGIQHVSEHNDKIELRNFDQFRESRLIKSKICYGSWKELNNSAELNVDAYICGSDQVWRYFSYDSYGYANFLNFGPSHVRRIAYSASFGTNCIDQKFIKYAKPLFKRFNHIGVREESGINLCKKLDRDDAVFVMDPVFLAPQHAYDNVIKQFESLKNTSYTFYYFLEAEMDIPWSIIQKRTKDNNSFDYFVPVYNRDFPFEKFQDPTIEEWIARIKYAKEVFTNSFHGSCFSIIFKKNFLVFLRKNCSMNDRLVSLLHSLGLEDRIYNPEIGLDEQMDASIDWISVHQKLGKKIQDSRSFLSSALE